VSFEAKLQEMGYTLKPIELNAGRLMLAVRTGNLVYTSGQVPNRDGRAIKGKVGQDVSVEEGYEAAKLATLNCLESIRTVVGSLDNVVRIVKVFGMVNVAPDFNDTPAVIHGCSDLLIELFGEAGRHARSAIGLTVPHNWAVEIEIIAEVK
jgi:enamine deaminase RidA (YjgF/YER057c/UK114 family)